MKKLIYFLLLTFGWNVQLIHAQCANQILSIDGPLQDPCVGDYDFRFILNWSQGISSPGSFTWTRQSGSPLPSGFNAFPDGNVQFTSPADTSMTDIYICTFVDTNACVQIISVPLTVHPKPNGGWYNLSTNCAGVTLYPGGGTNYLALDNNGSYTIPFDSLFFPNGHDKSIHKVVNGGGFRVFNQYGCYSDVAFYQIWVYPLVIDLQASRRRIAPGQSTTLTASTIWNTQNSKTKWFKNNQLFASGVDSVTVSDTGIYKVQMRATLAAGNCVNSKQIKITPKPVVSARMGAENELIEGKESMLDLQVGPNPASDQIQISGYDEKVEILDVNGRIVGLYYFNTFDGTSIQMVDVSVLQDGMYLVRSGEQTVKLIIRH